MNKYISHFHESIGPRDKFFHEAITHLGGRSARILEVGALRELSPHSRFTDGWSSIFWCDYIAKYGGSLDIVDIDISNLNNCRQALEGLAAKITFINGDARDYISNDYDLIYLDGSDDPNEMLDQFLMIDRSKTIILCDDFNSKGSVLRHRHSDFTLMEDSSGLTMALYPRLS